MTVYRLATSGEILASMLLRLPPEIFAARDQIIVCGSGPMAIRGMRDPNDLDLLVTADLFARAPAFGFEPAPHEHAYKDDEADGDTTARRLLQYVNGNGQKTDLFLTTPKLDHTFEQQIERGISTFDVPGADVWQFQNLADVLAIKLAVIQANRPSKAKHLADVPALAAAIVRDSCNGDDL